MQDIHKEDRYPYQELAENGLSAAGDDVCSADFLLISNAVKNPTKRTGSKSYAPTKDRFCGGKLNFDSSKNSSDSIYSQISSNLYWLQVGSRTRQRQIEKGTHSFFAFQFVTGSNSSVGAPSTTQGFRILYSQMTFCES